MILINQIDELDTLTINGLNENITDSTLKEFFKCRLDVPENFLNVEFNKLVKDCSLYGYSTIGDINRTIKKDFDKLLEN